MTKEELFNVADHLANYLMENGRQMMLKNAELQIKVAILKEREECAKIAEAYANGLERNYSEIIADKIRTREQE